MSEPAIPDKHVPHEDEVAAAVDDQLARTSNHAAIEDLEVLDTETLDVPSSTYVEAEAVAGAAAVNDLLTAVAAAQSTLNEVLDVLRDAELIPTSE